MVLLRVALLATSFALMATLPCTAQSQDQRDDWKHYVGGTFVVAGQPEGTPDGHYWSGAVGGSSIGAALTVGTWLNSALALECDLRALMSLSDSQGQHVFGSQFET